MTAGLIRLRVAKVYGLGRPETGRLSHSEMDFLRFCPETQFPLSNSFRHKPKRSKVLRSIATTLIHPWHGRCRTTGIATRDWHLPQGSHAADTSDFR
jgi:hypothetical protein